MFKRFMPQRGPVIQVSPGKPAQSTIEQVLDSCLNEIQAHHNRLADCLQKHPSCADELRPLLTIALEIQAVPSVSPSAAFRRDLRRQLLEQRGDGAFQFPHSRIIRTGSRWKKVLVALVLMTAISLFLLGAVVISSTSLPGSPLYPIKRWTERIQVGLAEEPGPVWVHANLARRRLEEVKALARYGKADLANQTAFDYEGEINSAIDGLKADQNNRVSGAAQDLRRQLVEEQAALDLFQTQIPPSSVPAVRYVQAAMTKVIGELDTPAGGK